MTSKQGVVKLRGYYVVNAHKIFNENILFYSELTILYSDINRTKDLSSQHFYIQLKSLGAPNRPTALYV